MQIGRRADPKRPDQPSEIRLLLNRLTGRRVAILPLTDARGRAFGNNGDLLMLRVFEHMLADAKIVRVPFAQATNADYILVPPNGSMLEVYDFPGLLKMRLQGLESIPVIIFPTSALFTTQDPAQLFAGRSAHTQWFLRESHSYSHLQRDWGENLKAAHVDLVLDADSVMSGRRYVAGIVGAPLTETIVLVAGRNDKEATSLTEEVPSRNSAGMLVQSAARIFMTLPQTRIKTKVGRSLKGTQNRENAATLLRALSSQDRCRIDALSLDRVQVDISAPQFATFDQYCRSLRSSAVIVTNRLHVALPGALLGKTVYLVDSGYHKLRGVYEYSLSSFDNVTFVERP